MSRLKELRLHGFKSFADPTRFVFERGVNAVIGPNGSGKSNMADAIRWVLGEQSNRSLRTRRADDVIFAGSDQRRPLGMAEALLTLDNADGWLPIEFSEVSIGRRSYRSGEGEYLINGARARLRDVVQLLGEGRLGANELVVVGQGTVDAALSLRPEERRQLFEEAAGVKALQVKRNEASARLARALDNLSRVTDIVAELKPQVRRLALQAEHQQQHDELGARARALVVASHRRRERAARSALGDARRGLAAAEAALEAFRASQEAGREELATAEADYWRAEEAARDAGHAREETRAAVIRAESRLEALDARLRELGAAIARDRHDLAAAERLLDGMEDPSTDAGVAAALSEAARAEAAWRAAVTALARADDDLLAAEEELATLRARHSDRVAAAAREVEEASRRAARRDDLVQELAERANELRRRTGEADAAARVVAAAAGRVDAAATALKEAADERDTGQAGADAAQVEVVTLTEQLRALRAELEAIAEPHDGSTGLAQRLASAGWSALLDSVEAPEASWPAVEAVVGGDLQAALLWSDGDPTAAVADARGSARLLSVEPALAEPERAAALAAVDGERTLAEWIGGTPAPRAFARTAVARDLDALLAGRSKLPPGWCAVTADGDLADARGLVILRGRSSPPGGAAARVHARRRELAERVVETERRLGAAQAKAHSATERLRASRDRHLAATQAHDEAEAVLRRGRREAEVTAAEAQRLERRVRELEAELSRADADDVGSAPTAAWPPNDAAAEMEALRARAAEARRRRDELAGERDAARARWTAQRHAAEEAENRVAGRRSQRVLAEGRVAQLRSSGPEREQAHAELIADRAQLAEELERARGADRDAATHAASAEDARRARREHLLQLERAQGGATARLVELERAAQAAAVEALRRDEALVALARERELALEGLPDRDAPAESADIDQLADDELDAELRRVRRMLAHIGSVNPFAVDEHRQLSDRLAEMSGQEVDLRAAIASTEELIARLDGEITGQFDAAFRAIAERFDEFCRLLFAGGSGSLQMADEADGDAPGGIEIVVRPPGKRLQRLAMLSGGERALTGVALLFAMLTVNPVPFCILDEVDAALDEANIGRFAAALRRLSESIDFVVITHNRATIEVADTIYGVTMTDAAVSRVLSLRLADVPVEVSA